MPTDPPPPKILMEDGTSAILMENGTSAVLMEGDQPANVQGRPKKWVPSHYYRRRIRGR
jgi:hypothetical protein